MPRGRIGNFPTSEFGGAGINKVRDLKVGREKKKSSQEPLRRDSGLGTLVE
jgi:hypothetical protein